MAMNDDFAGVRELCEDYYQQRISKEEYRVQRSILLNKIDMEMNHENNSGAGHDAGFVDKIMSIFKNKDEENIT